MCQNYLLHKLTRMDAINIFMTNELGPVVQSIVSLKSSLRGKLVKCFTTLKPTTLIFFSKDERSFCTAKASHIFSTKNIGIFEKLLSENLTKR